MSDITIHDLKIKPEYLEAILVGEKNFELRKDDRGYKVGDYIRLYEYENGQETGKFSSPLLIKFILRDCKQYGLMDGYCILGL